MKKRLLLKNVKKYFTHSSQIRKHLLMSVLAIAFLAAPGHLQAQTRNQVTLSMQNAKLKDVIKSIEKQTGFAFFYNNENVDPEKDVNIQIKDGSIEEAIRQILPGQAYKIEKGKIILLPGQLTEKETKEVKGTVIDENGDPIIGASILLKGTQSGTATDIDGKFILKAGTGDMMIISYLGYRQKEVKITSINDYTITLEENNRVLNEVVVVGYGVEKKVNVIGSIAQIGADKLENRSTPQLSNALTGQMSGVTVIQRSGRPGYGTGEIRVRGVGTFSGDDALTNKSDALVLIDGIPGKIDDVSNEDVESISVLKDASTAAIYGARAANGVILITTKTGKEGKVSVGYSGYVGWSKATELPEFVNSWEWATLYNQAKGQEIYSPADIQSMRDGSNPDRYGNVHYLDEVLNHTGFQTGHDLTINGGDKKNKYLISLGLLSQDGIIEKNNFTRYNIRANLTNQLASNLHLTTRISGLYSRIKEPGETGGDDTDGMIGIVQQAIRMPAPFPAILSDGTFGAGPMQRGTPISALKSPSFFKKPKYAADINLRLDYTPIKDLKLSVIAAYKLEDSDEKKFRSTQILDGNRELGPSTIKVTNMKERYKTFQALADYNKSLGKHNFGLLLGYSWEDRDYREVFAFRDNLLGNDKPEISVGAPGNQQNGSKGWDWAMQSVFGRFKYNFDERYLFEATMRNDGSSRFSDKKRYALFPSFAVGWRVSEEAFIKDNSRLGWINNLKLKASWGKLGNENTGDYASLLLYQGGQNYPIGGSFLPGVAVTKGRDENRRWEETKTIDGGFESILWNGLLSANVSYFFRETTGILNKPNTVSWVWGLEPAARNAGKLRNTGWEIELGHRNKIGELNYNIGVNMSFIKNKVLTLGPDSDIPQQNGMIGNGSSLFVGYPIEMYYGYKTDGVFIDQADIDSWYDQSAINPNPKPGDIRYVPVNKDDKTVDPNKDRQFLGSRIPKFTYGISLGLAYRDFDLAVLLQGVGNVKGRLEDFAGLAFRSDVGNVQRWQANGAFDPENPTRNPKYPRLETLSNVESANTYISDFWIQNASYLRVKNIQLGYSLPDKLLQKIRMAGIRIYMQAENPFTFHNYPEGWDPEINTAGKYYPILKTYTFGLNLKF